MDFKDYYATLGVERTATQDEIKRAYRKLARKFHPDLNKEADAEERFKEVAEAHEALIDPERRAAYDDVASRQGREQSFSPPPGWDSGYEFSGRGARPAGGHEDADFSDFFESLFGRTQGMEGGQSRAAQGRDHHAKIVVDLLDVYQGAKRTISLHAPVAGANGAMSMKERQLEIDIPKGVREGQHLRLQGQGTVGMGGAPAGDLYLEIAIRAQAPFRIDGADVYVDLAVAPWEAALGAAVTAPIPTGSVELTVPAGSSQGRKLRLRGKGLPGKTPGDLYVVLRVVLPKADSEASKAAYTAFAAGFPRFDPRLAAES